MQFYVISLLICLEHLSHSPWHTPSLSEGGGGGGPWGMSACFQGGKVLLHLWSDFKAPLLSQRGFGRGWGGSTHEKTTWSSVVLRAAPLAEPPARLNSGRGRPVGKPPLTGPRKRSLSSAHTLSTREAQSTVRPLISHYHNGLGTVTVVQILL